jgi:hypothetical protein
VHDPALAAPLRNEGLKHEIIQQQRAELPAFGLWCEKQAPSAIHIHSGRWTLRPDGIPICHGKRGKDGSHGVGGERPIEIPQPSRTNEDHGSDNQSGNQSSAKSGFVEILHGSPNALRLPKLQETLYGRQILPIEVD